MRFGGILLVTLLLVGSCSDPEPKEPKSIPNSPTPTATAPTMPAQATENTPEGAAAFVKHYIDVFNYASNTGDVEELRDLSDDCEACEKYAAKFNSIYARGDKISAHLWTLTSADLEQDDHGTHVTAAVDVDEGQIKKYKFRFELPRRPPFSVQSIAIVEQS